MTAFKVNNTVVFLKPEILHFDFFQELNEMIPGFQML